MVRAVSAESALENDAATIPMVNNTTTTFPNTPVAANMGNNSSGLAGKDKPFWAAKSDNNTPKNKNKRFAGIKAKP